MIVEITAEQTVRYKQFVKIEEGQWSRIEALSGLEKEREILHLAERVVDLRDVCDADEIENIEIQKLDSQGKPTGEWLND